jgi:hypothetical protein
MLLRFCFTFFLLIIYNNGYSCFCAEHHRSFLLGENKDSIFVMQTELNRSDYVDRKNTLAETQAYWYGSVFLVTYDKKLNKLSKVNWTETKILPDDNFIEKLEQIRQSMVQKLNENKTFSVAMPMDISFCDFQKSCKVVKLIQDDSKETCYLNYLDKNHEIKALKDSANPIFDLFFYESYKYKSIKDKLYINSVRKYKLAQYQVLIIHVSSGSHAESSNSSEFIPVLNPKEHVPECISSFLDKGSIFEEPVLTHGKGFDVLIIQ